MSGRLLSDIHPPNSQTLFEGSISPQSVSTTYIG